MKKIPIYNLNGEIINEESFSDEFLKEKVNKDVLYYYVVSYLSNQRQGTSSTKTRGEVRGGGKKPWRQKGTGRARVGSIRNPIWRHGGVAFGPKPRDYRIDLPKKVKKKALIESLKDKFIEDKAIILEIENIDVPKTKIFSEFLKKIKIEKEKILFILNNQINFKENLIKSIRNLPMVEYDFEDKLNAYEILNNDRLVILKDSFPLIKKYLEIQ